MTDTYQTIANTAEGYYTEKRSKFYAFAHHVTSADEVKDLQAFIRTKNASGEKANVDIFEFGDYLSNISWFIR